MMAYQDPGPGPGQGGSTTEVAREQAGRVGQTASEAGSQVAQTTKEQARNVADEARQQARDLVGEARTQVRDQASTQRDQAVQGLRALGDELDQMAQRGGQSGIATEVARRASGRTRELAGYLDGRDPADLIDELRAYARRRPVVFLAGAALAGVVAGRLTRGLAASTGGADDHPAGRSALDSPGYLAAGGSAALATGQPPGEQLPEPYPGGYAVPDPALSGAGQVAGPAYSGTGYESTGYEPSGYGAPEDGGTGPGGFRDPDATTGPGDVAYPPAPAPGYQPAPDPAFPEVPEPAFPEAPEPAVPDPTLDPEQRPARGWNP
jgi:hypothetical protein